MAIANKNLIKRAILTQEAAAREERLRRDAEEGQSVSSSNVS